MKQRAALAAAVVMTLCLLGDATLYLVLPATAESFGLSAFWLGAALSVNRFIRLLLNQPVALLMHRVGLRAATIGAVVLAVASTLAYGVIWGALAFMVARIAWGSSFAILRLSVLGYATIDQSRSASRLGFSAGIQALGPAVVLLLGGWAVTVIGPRELFLVLGSVSLLALPLAWWLPNTSESKTPQGVWPRLKLPSSTEAIVFVGAIMVDGVLTAGIVLLLLAHEWSVAVAVQAGGIFLAGRRLSAIVIGPLAGLAGQRWGLSGPFVCLVLLLCAGLLTLSLGYVLAGAAVLMLFAAGMQALAPGLIVERASGDRLLPLSFLATWRDLGAAIGALAAPALTLMAPVHQSVFFASATAILLALLIWHAVEALPRQAV